MNNLSSEIVPLLSYYDDLLRRNSLKESGPKFKVGEALSSVASFYERLRYAVDYKKEHLLRRNAIERISTDIILGSRFPSISQEQIPISQSFHLVSFFCVG